MTFIDVTKRDQSRGRPVLDIPTGFVYGAAVPSLWRIGERTMKPELTYLAWTAAMTALMWIPYVVERMKAWGLADTVGYPSAPKPQAPWATRMKAAHANAIENLAVFATLVLVANAAGISNGTTVFAAALYF